MSRIKIENLRNPVTKKDFEGREDVTKGYIDGTKIDASRRKENDYETD